MLKTFFSLRLAAAPSPAAHIPSRPVGGITLGELNLLLYCKPREAKMVLEHNGR